MTHFTGHLCPSSFINFFTNQLLQACKEVFVAEFTETLAKQCQGKVPLQMVSSPAFCLLVILLLSMCLCSYLK